MSVICQGETMNQNADHDAVQLNTLQCQSTQYQARVKVNRKVGNTYCQRIVYGQLTQHSIGITVNQTS